MAARMTWRKDKGRKWINGHCFTLHYCGEPVAHVNPIKGGYYWYCLGKNTANAPCLRVEVAKAECLVFVKPRLDELRLQFKKADKELI